MGNKPRWTNILTGQVQEGLGGAASSMTFSGCRSF